MSQDAIDKSVETYKKLNLACIVMIGGDGSFNVGPDSALNLILKIGTMSIGYELAKHGINFVGVPKTIDNDLQATDQTFGYARIYSQSLKLTCVKI